MENFTTIKTVIIEDEPFVRDDLRFMLSEFPEVEIIGEAETFNDAKSLLQTSSPDSVFLDIHLRGGNGLDLLPHIKKNTGIVILTAHKKSGDRVTDDRVMASITKPATHERLDSALTRIISMKNKC